MFPIFLGCVLCSQLGPDGVMDIDTDRPCLPENRAVYENISGSPPEPFTAFRCNIYLTKVAFRFIDQLGNDFANSCGGAIYASSSYLKLLKTNFSYCSSALGAGIMLNNSQLQCEQCQFIYLSSLSQGGSIYATNCPIIYINMSMFDSCRANSRGGALAIKNTEKVLILRSFFWYNNAINRGGAMFFKNTNCSIHNSEFEYNYVGMYAIGQVAYLKQTLSDANASYLDVFITGGAIYFEMTEDSYDYDLCWGNKQLMTTNCSFYWNEVSTNNAKGRDVSLLGLALYKSVNDWFTESPTTSIYWSAEYEGLVNFTRDVCVLILSPSVHLQPQPRLNVANINSPNQLLTTMNVLTPVVTYTAVFKDEKCPVEPTSTYKPGGNNQHNIDNQQVNAPTDPVWPALVSVAGVLIVSMAVIIGYLWYHKKSKYEESSEHIEMANVEETVIETSTIVTHDNPLWSTKDANVDDPFANDFEEDEIHREHGTV